jgi:hypothetical protein
VTARRWWPVLFAAGAAAGVAAAWFDLADIRARLHQLGGAPTPPPRRVTLMPPFDAEREGW